MTFVSFIVLLILFNPEDICEALLARSFESCTLENCPDTSNGLARPKPVSPATCNSSSVCPPGKICVRKCCPPDQELDFGTAATSKIKCHPSNKSDEFWNYVAFGEFKSWNNLTVDFKDLFLIYGMPCNDMYLLDPRLSESDAYLLVENGSLINDNKSENEYCVDYVKNEQTILPLMGDWERPDSTPILESGFFGDLEKLDRILKIYSLSLSVIFLILTYFVYTVVSSLQNLQGKNLQCHVLTLIVGYSALLIVSGIVQLPDDICVISAFVVQFSFLASFFWLNVMCFDLWCTFSGYRSFNGSLKERDLKKFLAYCLYAWGCPTLIVGVTVFVEFYPYLPKNFIKPKFGKTKCFFETDEAVFIYFYSFISIILVSNLCMFISTAIILKKHEKEVKVFKRSGSKRHLDNDKQRFNLYIKLFVVMGVNWIMDVVSFYIREPAIFFLITDIINMLQGVLIFIIFVCKRRIFLLLKKKLCDKKETLGRQRTRNISTATSVISLTSMRGGSSGSGIVQPKARQESVC